jgi:hypothetical protein
MATAHRHWGEPFSQAGFEELSQALAPAETPSFKPPSVGEGACLYSFSQSSTQPI